MEILLKEIKKTGVENCKINDMITKLQSQNEDISKWIPIIILKNLQKQFNSIQFNSLNFFFINPWMRLNVTVGYWQFFTDLV